MARASSELIIKAMKLVFLLIQKEGVTTTDIADELEICSRNAQHWLMAASLVLPIYSPNEETRLQTESIVYSISKEFKENPLRESLKKRVETAIRYFKRRRISRQNFEKRKVERQSK